MANLQASGFGSSSGPFGGVYAGSYGQYDPGVMGAQFASQTELAKQQGKIQSGLTAQQIAGQQAVTGQQVAGQESVAGTQAQAGITEAQTAAQAAMFPSQVRQQEFGKLFPFFTQQFGNLSGQSGATGAGGTGGTTGSPEISVKPVYDQQQIRQQVNQTQAQNSATGASQQRTNQAGLAGRGFGSNSPLLQALNQGQQFSTNQLNSQAAQQIPFNAAQANQQAILGSQSARESQFASRQQEQIARQQQLTTQKTAMMAALAGLI